MERKRMVRTRLTELCVKARTRGGEDAFVVSTSELMKLLGMKDIVEIVPGECETTPSV